MLEDPDSLPHFLPTAWMDRQALEVQEDLDMVLRELDSQLFMPVDMRCAVVIAVHGEVTVGVQLRRLPLPAVVFHTGQRLESGFLDLLEPFTAGDAKATVGLVVDALDAHHQCAIDLGDRRKSGATKAEPEGAGEDFHESLCDCFI